MEGVEILSSTSIYNTFLPEWMAVISFILIFVVFIVGIVIVYAERYSWLIPCAVVLVAVFAVAIFGGIDNKNSIHHMEHKVIVNDSVKMNDFLEYYEVLDQEGKIYTVRERE